MRPLTEQPATRLSPLRRAENAVCATLILVMITAGVLAVLRRFLVKLPVIGKFILGGSLSWPEPLAQHLVLWVALFGAAAATADRSHIAIDTLSYILKERGRRWVGLVTNLITVAVCVIFGWLSVGFVTAEFRDNPDNIAFLGLHDCWLALVVPAGFTLMCIRGLIVFGRDIRYLFLTPPSAPSSPDETPHDTRGAAASPGEAPAP